MIKCLPPSPCKNVCFQYPICGKCIWVFWRHFANCEWIFIRATFEQCIWTLQWDNIWLRSIYQFESHDTTWNLDWLNLRSTHAHEDECLGVSCCISVDCVYLAGFWSTWYMYESCDFRCKRNVFGCGLMDNNLYSYWLSHLVQHMRSLSAGVVLWRKPTIDMIYVGVVLLLLL